VTHAELTALLQASSEALRLRPRVPLALATLVAVDGSSYRQPGARMLCDAEGRVLAGAISGGCLEGDVALRASEVCASGNGVLISYDLRNDLEAIWGFGTGCDGVAHILLAPFTASSALHEAHQAAEQRTAGTLLTVVQAADAALVGTSWFHLGHPDLDVAQSRGLSPAVRALAGTVHAAVQRTSRPLLSSAPPDLTPPSPAPSVAASRASSAGDVQLFGAPVQPAVQLIVVGASRGAEAFARVAHASGWQVTVVDHRAEALDALSLPTSADRIPVAADAADESVQSGQLVCDRRTAIAVCTHRFEHDLLWIAAALRTEVPYIGVLGSRQRAARLVRALGDGEAPIRVRDRSRLYAPLGLDIGGESPEEIALAAVAEIQAVLSARPGGSLRERRGPLHARSSTPDLPPDRAPATCAVDAPRPRR
jgi:xanthine dehydrogenase accessory factor